MSSAPLMLDSGPLSMLVHPTLDLAFAGWFAAARREFEL
jgi:hypothetical protein